MRNTSYEFYLQSEIENLLRYVCSEKIAFNLRIPAETEQVALRLYLYCLIKVNGEMP